MAETTPLLPQANNPPHDHPIFLRVCHSPWLFLGQKSLSGVRGFLAIYMTTVLALDLVFEIVYAKRGRLLLFFISDLSYVIQIIYYWITFTWTLQHFMTPHGRAASDSLDSHSLWSRGTALFQIPRTTGPRAKNPILFSIFYTATVTLPFVVTIVFWLILVPTKATVNHVGPMAIGKTHHETIAPRPPVEGGAEGNPFRDGALKAFVLINVNAFNTVIALLEILVLSSVRKQKPLDTHIIGLLVICSIYFAWTGIGRLITGKYVYKYLDPNYKGWKPVVVAVVNMMAMTVTMFMVQLGLHGLREKATAEAERERRGRSAS